MELAFVLLCVLLGSGAIVYAGLRQPIGRREATPADAPTPEAGDTPGSEGPG